MKELVGSSPKRYSIEPLWQMCIGQNLRWALLETSSDVSLDDGEPPAHGKLWPCTGHNLSLVTICQPPKKTTPYTMPGVRQVGTQLVWLHNLSFPLGIGLLSCPCRNQGWWWVKVCWFNYTTEFPHGELLLCSHLIENAALPALCPANWWSGIWEMLCSNWPEASTKCESGAKYCLVSSGGLKHSQKALGIGFRFDPHKMLSVSETPSFISTLWSSWHSMHVRRDPNLFKQQTWETAAFIWAAKTFPFLILSCFCYVQMYKINKVCFTFVLEAIWEKSWFKPQVWKTSQCIC